MLSEKFEVSISKNKMSASLKQKLPLNDGERITKEDLINFLKEQGVIYGIKEDAIVSIIGQLHSGLTGPITVAEGLDPIPGKNAYLKPIDISDKKNDTQDEKNMVNLKEVIHIPVVKKGDFIGEKIPATLGTNGKNVCGEDVIAKPGKDFVLRKGKNTTLSPDGLKMFAAVDGQISIQKKTIDVYPVFEVKGDLDMRTGNIDFIGNVTIRGNVPTGFEIKANGDIHVFGTVEGAVLQSGGSIFVSAGIVGQGNGKIIAKNDLHTNFINQGNVEVEGDIHVTHSILHSNVIAGGNIYCFKGKGNVVGGNISAGKNIHIKESGNTMHTLTNYFFGSNQKILEKRKFLQTEIKKLSEELEKLNKLEKMYLKKEQTGVELTIKEKVMKLKIRNTVQDIKERIKEYKEELQEISNDENEIGFLLVDQNLYENTTVTFGKYTRKLTKSYKYVKVMLEDSEIKILGQ